MIFVEETDERFYIAPSTIPNAGNGCFAKIPLKKNDWLEVIGVYVKTNGLADQCTQYAKRYKFAGSDKLDAKIVPMGYGGMVNHSDELSNCKLVYEKGLNKRSQHAGQIIYKFTRDIMAGEEIIGNYGTNAGQEITKISENIEFISTNKEQVETLLKYNLYNLNNVLKSLSYP
jgi:hypothetical protein